MELTVTSSKDEGRTIWEMITGKNKKDTTPLELKYFNPLKIKVGDFVNINDYPELKGLDFEVKKIVVYELNIDVGRSSKTFYHTDYCLKGFTADGKAIRLQLRLEKDENSSNKVECSFKLFRLYHEEPYNKELVEYLNKPAFFESEESDEPDDYCFCINQDEDGNDLEESLMYWRIDGFDSNGRLAIDEPYKAKVTVLIDENEDGQIQEEELDQYYVQYWDYHREYMNEGSPTLEYLYAEMDDSTGYISMFKGEHIQASQVFVI